MSEVIDFTPRREVVTIGKEVVQKPRNADELLAICKRFLIDDDYRDILCGIMDLDFYAELEPDLKKLVDVYFKMGRL